MGDQPTKGSSASVGHVAQEIKDARETKDSLAPDDKAKVDAEADDSKLTGSDRTADVAVAPDGARFYDYFETKEKAPAGQSGKQGEPDSLQPFTEALPTEADKKSVPPEDMASSVAPKTRTEAETDELKLTSSDSAAADTGGAAVLLRKFPAAKDFSDIVTLLSNARSDGRKLIVVQRTADGKSQVGTPLDRGGMFSSGMGTAELQDHVDSLKSDWKNAPKINVVQSVSDLPFKAPSDARGAFHKGQVYLVADNLNSAEEAQFVLFHETLGHAGLRGMFGDSVAKEMNLLALKNAVIRQA